ncbi:hypothetical protein [Pseudomonas congelans]|uniref:hypothetical protein n=1 Tax=Pseudomonas congelans TaxID=200452 RepID=UPI001BDC8336|nr:hypothetical protein [Pseudomonas congelans]QVX09221.1 hypothetical protein DBV21_04695 [Pseudomonas congelans]
MKADDDHYKLYEKIYFFEAERKEKLIARLNLPLAMLVALSSFLSYLQSKAPPSTSTAGIYFWIFFLCCAVCVAIGIGHFARAWRIRNDDLTLPTSAALEAHRLELITYYGEGGADTANGFFIQTIVDYFVNCATKNSLNNDGRGVELDLLSKFVIWSIVLALLSFIPFFIYNNP